MSLSEYLAPLIGRVVLAWYFATQAWFALSGWHGTLAAMNEKHVPAAPLILLIALVVMALGALALLLGFHTRHGALALFAFTLLAAILMHDFWHIQEAAARDAAWQLFARDMAIAGALLFIVGLGPGRFAIDNRGE